MAVPPKKFIKNNHGVLSLNPEYQKWKKGGGGGKSSSSTKSPPQAAPIDKMTVQITLVKGQGLVAKDRNLLGKKTTSDPYVEIYLISGSGAPGTKYSKTKIGTTKTVYKNLNPVWDYTNKFTIPFLGNAKCQLIFHIFDYDKLSDPDSMGVVTVPLEWNDIQQPPTFRTVPPNSAKNASGQIEIGIQSSVHRLQGMKSYF